MRALLAAAIVTLGAIACGPTSAGTTGAASPARSAGLSAAAPTPGATKLSTRLDCGNGYSPAKDMALYRFRDSASSPPVLEVLDVTNPLKPALMCSLSPADGGRFDQSSGEIAFWAGDRLGTVDLASGRVVQLGHLSAVPSEGVYSSNGALFAYRVFTDAGGMYTHLYRLGPEPADRTLYAQEPMGGHGGVPGGPNDQLQFSPDGKELLDYSTYRPTTGPANLLVFRSDGTRLFQQSGGASGVWAPTGSILYFSVTGQQLFTGEIDSLDETGRRTTVARGISGYEWPAMAPAGGSIIFDAYDTSAPGEATGGLPHLWRLDMSSGGTSQLTTAVSSEPVFVGTTVVWTSEEQPCRCGPGGASMPDGVILAYDLSTGSYARVDMSSTVPGLGASPAGSSPAAVLDVWFS